MNQRFTFDKDYLIIMRQKIQTTVPQTINRIEIGKIIAETNKYLVLQLDNSKRYLRKSLIAGMIDITNISIVHTQYFVDGIKGLLR
jgi:hypothetical protein